MNIFFSFDDSVDRMLVKELRFSSMKHTMDIEGSEVSELKEDSE